MLADLADGRVLPVPGGVLVRDQERRVIGAVGASGDTAVGKIGKNRPGRDGEKS
jgi:uncharacterized protein GlcG (DUF336 family)